MSGELDNFGFHTYGMSFYSMAAVKTEQRNLLSEKAREDGMEGEEENQAFSKDYDCRARQLWQSWQQWIGRVLKKQNKSLKIIEMFTLKKLNC